MGKRKGSSRVRIPTLSEKLTNNFYLWEKRGRGWQVWDYPVDLEPAYQPFYHEFALPEGPGVDDGRKPRLITSFFKMLFSSNQKQESESHDNEVYLNAAPLAFIDDSHLKEITVSLPSRHKVSIDQTEQLLLNLSYCALPLSFEVIGASDFINVQITCRSPDLYQVTQQLQAYFPDAILHEEDYFLEKFMNRENPVAIIDFGLSNEFMRPLRTYRSLESDPLVGIIGALENLRQKEIGLFQVLFQATLNTWPEDIIRSVTDWQGRSFFADSPEMVHLASQKVKRPLFSTIVRTAAQSPSQQRSWEIARAIASGLHQVTSPQSNELIPLSNEHYEDSTHLVDIIFRETHRSGMLLNSEELASLVHLPTPSVRSSKLLRYIKKTKEAPVIALGHQLALGENTHHDRTEKVTLKSDQRLRHMHIIGATGTGKSTLLLNLMYQDINNGLGLAVLDPHGDLIDKIVGYIPEERFDDVILLDPSDAEYPVGLNILSAHSEIERIVLSSDLVSLFRRFSTSWGDQMTSVLTNAVLAILESEKGGTLLDLKRFLVDKHFRKDFLETVRDPKVSYYWQHDFPLLSSKSLGPILTRLDTFLRSNLISSMLAQKKGLNFEDILNNKKILLAKLAQGLIGEENSYLLGALIISKIHQAAMSRQSREISERANFYLSIDEFQNFITPSMASVLSGARKYNLGLILAHQEMRQLWSQDEEIAHSVISNPSTRICFRLGDFDANKLSNGFSFFEARDFQNLGIGEAIGRIEKAEYDFNLKTHLLPAIDQDLFKERTERIRALSREKYATKYEYIKEIIEKQLGKSSYPPPKVTAPRKIAPPEAPIEKKIKPEGEEISDEELSFLSFLHENPGMFVTKIYQALGLSGYKGDSLKESLIKKGFLKQEETRSGRGGRLAKILVLTEKAEKFIKTQPQIGKGGDLHKQLQQMIKEQAETFGWKAKIEEKIPGFLESVDVGLAKEDLKVAVEITITTKGDYEVQNIRKCLDAGYDYVLCVSSEGKHLAIVKTRVRKSFAPRERERIRFYLSSRVKDFLSSPPFVSIVSEKAVVSDIFPSQKQFLDTDEVSELLGVSKNTIYQWVHQKKIPHVKVGRLTKFRREELEVWIRNRSKDEEQKDFLD
jgi:excisionase family DNA binding protein